MTTPDPVPVPAGQVHPAHLAACLPGITEAALLRLRDCPRLEDRLSSLVAKRLALPDLPGRPTTPADRLALQRPEALHYAARLMGAGWHAHSVCAHVRAAEVSVLVAGIGAAAHRFALRNRALAVATAQPMTAAELVTSVAVAGTGCLAAWLDALSPALRARAALKLSPALAAAPRADAPPAVLEALIARAAQDTLDGV